MLKFVLPYDLSVRWNMYAYIWTLHCINVWLFNSQFDLFLKIDIFPKKYNLIREGIFFTFVAFVMFLTSYRRKRHVFRDA